MSDERWSLPESLRITNPAVRKQAEQMRADLQKKVNNPFVQLSPEEADRANAIRREAETRRALASTDDPQAVKTLKRRLADSLGQQGRYEEAAEIEDRGAYRAEHLAIAQALKGETVKCGCLPNNFIYGRDVPELGIVKGTKGRSPQTFTYKTVFDIQAGKFVDIEKCNSCGTLKVEK